MKERRKDCVCKLRGMKMKERRGEVTKGMNEREEYRRKGKKRKREREGKEREERKERERELIISLFSICRKIRDGRMGKEINR